MMSKNVVLFGGAILVIVRVARENPGRSSATATTARIALPSNVRFEPDNRFGRCSVADEVRRCHGVIAFPEISGIMPPAFAVDFVMEA
jgi:hypothetical protein